MSKQVLESKNYDYIFEFNKKKLPIKYAVNTKDGSTIIDFDICDPSSLLKTLNQSETSALIRKYNNFITIARNSIIQDSEGTKTRQVKNFLGSVMFVRKKKQFFGLLHSFHRRIVLTHFEGYGMVGRTAISIDGDVKTAISDRLHSNEYFLASMHLSNVDFSESIISDNLRKFLHQAGLFGYLLSIAIALASPTAYLIFSPHMPFDVHYSVANVTVSDIISLFYDGIFIGVLPGIAMRFGRRVFFKIILKKATGLIGRYIR